MAVPLVEHKLKLLPDLPGCYEMLNYAGKIIYVGKSKDLKHRVRSYFKSSHTGKVAKMVSEVRNFHTIYVSTDDESFLLEITLIQKYRPYFNIQLKQGHTSYPYIKITHERNPRLKMTSNLRHDGAYYFGPYPDVSAAEHTLDFLQKIYPLRRCNGYHKRPCLYYHMGQCLGACFRKVPRAVYDYQIRRIKTFLNGDCSIAKRILLKNMKEAASNLDFERAEEMKKLLYYIEKTVEGQKIISHDYTPRDIFNYYANNGWICIQVFYLRQARLMKRVRNYIPIMNDPVSDVMTFIMEFYNMQHQPIPKEILVPKQIPKGALHKALGVPVKTPQRGQKRSLLDMAYKNSKISLKTKFRLNVLNERDPSVAVKQLDRKLKIPYSKRIEAFDHADIQGRDTTSAMVAYINGKPQKNMYRKYKLHVYHHDELASTIEVVTRRCKRLMREHKSLPNLILIDGGIIQEHGVKIALKRLGLQNKIASAGMVKDARHRTHDVINSHYQPLHLNPSSPCFLLVTRIQDSIHNMVINYHRHLHKNNSFQSRLTLIQGVGKRTRNKLLRHFGNISNIANASISQIHKLGIPLKVANNIKLSLDKPVTHQRETPI